MLQMTLFEDFEPVAYEDVKVTVYVKEDGDWILGYLDPDGEPVTRFENCQTMHRILNSPPVHVYTEDEHYWYDEVVWLNK